MNSERNSETLIIGAGMAGLACARELQRHGRSCSIVDATDGVGGRLRTDAVDGFLLDRGFHVLLPATPEAKRLLDYETLDLRQFDRQAIVHWAGKQHRLADPFAYPGEALRTLRHPLVPWRDKWLLLLLRKHLFRMKELPRHHPEQPTLDYLHEWGFSPVLIDHFLRPFFGGIFMDRELTTSSRLFEFILAICDRAGPAMPARGIQAIPEQLAARLPNNSIRLNHRVVEVRPGEVVFENGLVQQTKNIVLATSEEEAQRLLPAAYPQRVATPRSTTCIYFKADQVTSTERLLHLDGDLRGPVNHLAVVSNLTPERAPKGKHLICATVLGSPSSASLVEVVTEQLRGWLGGEVDAWQHLRTYQIRNGQSEARLQSVGDQSLAVTLGNGFFRCNDYCEDPTLNGAMVSGRKAAEAIIGA
jgi:phytoene dehydrogenase-like protein